MIAHPFALMLFVSLCLSMAFANVAAAADPSYTSREWKGCTGGYSSGGFDDAGRTYVPCGNPTSIGIYSASGSLVDQIDLDFWVTDVAPTADGTQIYTAGPSGPARLSRGADGVWVRDAWRASTYRHDGASYAAGGFFVATDAAGNAYYADGAWAANQTHAVTKYDASGRAVTTFGSWANSWGVGTFYWMLTGLAVSPDGATVYTTEVGNNRVQTWTRSGGGSYSATASFGGTQANNADRGGYCDYVGWRGAFAAPYDVALDGGGNIYVINTTCKQVLRFTPGFGRLTANVDVRLVGGDYPRPHGFAVGRDGAVFIGENSRALVTSPTAAVAAPPVRRSTDAASPLPPTPSTSPAAPTSSTVNVVPVTAAPVAVAPAAATSSAPADVPAAAMHPSRRFALRIAARLGGIPAARRLRVAAGCGRPCRVRIEVRTKGRLVGLAIRQLPTASLTALEIRLGMRRVPGMTVITIREVGALNLLRPVTRSRVLGR